MTVVSDRGCREECRRSRVLGAPGGYTMSNGLLDRILILRFVDSVGYITAASSLFAFCLNARHPQTMFAVEGLKC